LRRLRREQKSKSPFVFVSERGTPFSTRGFQAMVERAARTAGFDMKIHPHMLRHSCGYKLANDGVDTRTIQGYLGHRSIQHTVRYTELAPTPYFGTNTLNHTAECLALLLNDVCTAPVRDTADAEEAIAKLGREPGGSLIVPPDAFTLVHDQLLVRLAQQHRVPAVYSFRISAARREPPSNTEPNHATANDGDLCFADVREAIRDDAAPFAGMTQTGSTGLISAANTAAPRAVCKE